MSIEDDITFMERIPLLGVLGRAALRVLAIGSETRHIETGHVLFEAGELADAGYLIQAGSFSLMSDAAADPGQNITASRGTLLGELALITETTRAATATALEPSAVMRISRTLFLKMLDGYPDSARKLRDSLKERADQATRDLSRVRAAFGEADGDS